MGAPISTAGPITAGTWPAAGMPGGARAASCASCCAAYDAQCTNRSSSSHFEVYTVTAGVPRWSRCSVMRLMLCGLLTGAAQPAHGKAVAWRVRRCLPACPGGAGAASCASCCAACRQLFAMQGEHM
jgi:hypothetical protein